MYQLTKLSQATQSYISGNISTISKTMTVSIAIAKVISDKLALPPAEIKGIDTYYLNNQFMTVNKYINSINELLVVDTKLIFDLVLRFYKLRYNSLIPVPSTIALCKDTAVEDFFGISRCFDKIIIDTIKSDPDALTKHVFNIRTLLGELNEGAVI